MCWNLPAGVTGNEPEITGEWAADCIDCGETFSDRTDDQCLINDKLEVVCNKCIVIRVREAVDGLDFKDVVDILNDELKKPVDGSLKP